MEAAEQKQSSENGQAKRRVRNLLLDKGFQLRWVAKVVLAATIIVSGMGYKLYRSVESSSDQLLAQLSNDKMLMADEAWKAIEEEIQRDKLMTLGSIVGGSAALVFLLGLLTIVSTHKIAGPAYKLRKLFSSINGDHLQLWAKLRKNDELQDTFVEFDDMLRRLREGRREDISDLEAIRNLMTEPSALAKMDDLLSRYRDSVKMD